MSHVWTSYVTHVWIRRVAPVNESCHTCAHTQCGVQPGGAGPDTSALHLAGYNGVAVCCVCCSVLLQRIPVCCSVQWRVLSLLQRVVCCADMSVNLASNNRVAVCCSVLLQCVVMRVAVCCSVLRVQCVVWTHLLLTILVLHCVVVYCSVLVYVVCVRVVCCSALPCVAVYDACDGAAGLRLDATATKIHIPRHTNTHAPIQTPPACACACVCVCACACACACACVYACAHACVCACACACASDCACACASEYTWKCRCKCEC